MASTLITGIGELATCDPSQGDGSLLGLLHDAAMVVASEQVAWTGPATDAPDCDEVVDVGGRAVIPGFVDSHTHLVFASDRAAEFAARMSGESYTGGGIRTTVAATRAATDEELRALARARVREMVASGTTTFEAKSGYGLSVAEEARICRISSEFTTETTYLGAHALPDEFAGNREGYLDLVCGDMLLACAPSARWIDVFCDPRAFDEDEAARVLAAGAMAGLFPRVHGNQLGHGPGVRLAVEMGAASVDHCTYLSDEDVDALAGSATVATLLPGADFSTRSPYPDARRLIDAGVTIALGTDLNPGTSYVTSMPFMIALAVREMRMTPAEALHAATRGGALALWRGDVGYLAPGSRADFAVLDAPSHVHLAYRPGSQLVAQTWKDGARIHG